MSLAHELEVEIIAEVRRLVDRLALLTSQRLAAPAPPYTSRAEAAHALAQRFVDGRRSTRRLEPLADDEPERTGDRTSLADPDAPRLIALLRSALKNALATISTRDRLRLTLYYARDLTLAVIGRQIGEHEATVSRHLARTRRQIRAAVEQRLRQDHGLDRAAIDTCWRLILADTADLDIGAMMEMDRKDPAVDRSKEQEGM